MSDFAGYLSGEGPSKDSEDIKAKVNHESMQPFQECSQ